MAETVKCDLLACGADLIVQQCNAVTRRAHGLAASIAERFPYADIYAQRPGFSANTAAKASAVGVAVLCRPPAGSSDSEPIVACLIAQVAPGKPGGWARQYKLRPEDDTAEKREEYFATALDDLATEIRRSEGKIKSVAFPHGIGCGLAGGSWSRYEAMIDRFARSLRGVKVKICKL